MIRHAITLERDGVEEKNDCTVRAIQNATGVPYRDAHAWAAKHGRKDGKGMHFNAILTDVVTSKEIVFGYRLRNVLACPQFKSQLETLASVMHLMRKGRYICLVKGHTFAVIDGVVQDMGTNGARKRCYGIYQLELSSVVEAREQGIAGVNGYWDLAAKGGR